MMTGQIEITYAQGLKLAELLHELRPDWDVKGCVNFIREARAARPGTANFDLTVACIRAAQNPENRTPAVLPLEGPHWHNAVPARPGSKTAPATRNNAICERCRYPHPPTEDCDVRKTDIDYDSPERQAARAAARRAAAAAAHRPALVTEQETSQ